MKAITILALTLSLYLVFATHGFPFVIGCYGIFVTLVSTISIVAAEFEKKNKKSF
jgi:hypothetical protein